MVDGLNRFWDGNVWGFRCIPWLGANEIEIDDDGGGLLDTKRFLFNEGKGTGFRVAVYIFVSGRKSCNTSLVVSLGKDVSFFFWGCAGGLRSWKGIARTAAFDDWMVVVIVCLCVKGTLLLARGA